MRHSRRDVDSRPKGRKLGGLDAGQAPVTAAEVPHMFEPEAAHEQVLVPAVGLALLRVEVESA